ncbi:MAG: hypothetical protein AB1405_05305 [Bdellovibrionota bacterium]
MSVPASSQRIVCSKCGLEQRPGPICARCGVLFSQHPPRMAAPAPGEPANTAPKPPSATQQSSPQRPVKGAKGVIDGPRCKKCRGTLRIQPSDFTLPVWIAGGALVAGAGAVSFKTEWLRMAAAILPALLLSVGIGLAYKAVTLACRCTLCDKRAPLADAPSFERGRFGQWFVRRAVTAVLVLAAGGGAAWAAIPYIQRPVTLGAGVDGFSGMLQVPWTHNHVNQKEAAVSTFAGTFQGTLWTASALGKGGPVYGFASLVSSSASDRAVDELTAAEFLDQALLPLGYDVPDESRAPGHSCAAKTDACFEISFEVSESGRRRAARAKVLRTGGNYGILFQLAPEGGPAGASEFLDSFSR